MAGRSRFGCQTCKIRRVKCDETLPWCKRCTSTGRRCDGPPKHRTLFVASQPSKQTYVPSKSDSLQQFAGPPSKQLASVPNLPASGKRALSFFIDCAGPALGGELDQEFWHASVLQLCQRSSMIRNAVLAVSTLYESPLSNPLSWPTTLSANFTKPEQRQAFKWYSESLNGMSEVLQQPQTMEQLQIALTTCILFACIEFQQLNVVNAVKLMKCGYNLLGQHTTKELTSRSPMIQHVILPVFVRQTIVLLTHGYPLPHGWMAPERKISETASIAISSLQDARTQLHLILLEAIVIINGAYLAFDDTNLADLQQARSRTLYHITVWRNSLDTYVSYISHHRPLTPTQIRALSLMKIYCLLATIWLTACIYPDEMIWDTLTSELTAILDYTETILSFHHIAQITYTFEMGTIPPLYFVGWRCRIPHLRRRALRLLSRCPVQESLYHRDIEIFALRKIIEIEEGLPCGADVLATQGIIPAEHARLRHVVIRWQADEVNDGTADDKSRPYLVYSQWVLREGEDGVMREMKPHIVSI